MAVKKKRSTKIIAESFKLLGCILLSLVAGFIGALFTKTGPGSWYSELIKPSFNPPNWVFGPVWTILYILMGIAFYIAIKNETGVRGVRLFITQLVLNLTWTLAFFGLQSTLLGVIVILILWIYILLTILEFHKKSRSAAYLLIPYLLWVTFATILTIAIYVLN